MNSLTRTHTCTKSRGKGIIRHRKMAERFSEPRFSNCNAAKGMRRRWRVPSGSDCRKRKGVWAKKPRRTRERYGGAGTEKRPRDRLENTGRLGDCQLEFQKKVGLAQLLHFEIAQGLIELTTHCPAFRGGLLDPNDAHHQQPVT